MAGIDLSKFLLAVYLEMQKRNDQHAMQQIKDLQDFCYTYRHWRSDVDPYTDTIAYLTSLEKIKDFFSRIGGNIFEILDLSWPLGITQEHFVIDEQEVKPSARVKLSELIAFVRNREAEKNAFLTYEYSYDPILEYKNVLLCERLSRVIQAIKVRFGDMLKKQNRHSYEIDRKLLNYLTVVPLVNGMRSLEQLVNQLGAPVNGQIECCQFNPEEIDMVIHDNPQFSNPVHTWEMVEQGNQRLIQTEAQAGSRDSGYISVPLF
jgi:hypothetical protein